MDKEGLENYKKKIKEKETLILFKVKDKYTKKNINFSIKNNSTHFRAHTLFTKEPVTIDWIRGFEDNSVFYDIGANIGVYSLYAAIVKKISVYAFEPESNNFQNLMENIILNRLTDKVMPYPIGLSDKTELTKLNLSQFTVGGSHHTVGLNAVDHTTLKPIETHFRQGIFSTTLDDLVFKWKFKMPNYIKIDVDGIEHKIITGSNKILNDKLLKSVLIEINESRQEDRYIIKTMTKNGFKFDEAQINKTRRKDGPHKDYVEYLFYR